METPAPGPSFPGAHPVARYWTALTFACCLGRTSSAVILLERGACVEGGAGITEDRGALTPLQVLHLPYPRNIFIFCNNNLQFFDTRLLAVLVI